MNFVRLIGLSLVVFLATSPTALGCATCLANVQNEKSATLFVVITAVMLTSVVALMGVLFYLARTYRVVKK